MRTRIKRKYKIFAIIILNILEFMIFLKIFKSDEIIIRYAVNPYNIVDKQPQLWSGIKILFIVNYFIISIIFTEFISNMYENGESKKKKMNNTIRSNGACENGLNVLIGKNTNNEKIFIPEKGLYQNILVTGTIGRKDE